MIKIGSRERRNIGERSGTQCTSHSERFVKGNLHIVKKACPRCNSLKALETNTHTSKCSKCGYEYR